MQRIIRSAAVRRAAVAAAVVAGALTAAPGPAQAFSQSDCDAAWGAGNSWATYVKVDTGTVGKVDFGDNWHLQGAPQGNAVVCFEENGGIKVMGRVFADDYNTVCAKAAVDIFYRDGNGNTVQAGTTTVREICGSYAANTYVERVGSVFGRNYVSARLRLYRDGTKVYDRTFSR